MRMHYSTLGDFVPGNFALPQNPVLMLKSTGMGEFVPAWYTVPQNPVRGLSGFGCGCGGGCGGKCGGMGAVDTSFTGTGIVSSIGSTLGISSLPAIPNWVVYGVVGLALLWPMTSNINTGRRRRSR